ncbi:hypothetical protein BC629DRAFT_1531686 [Irpex lacteus]|nr:hypothetical protein BC629DRAFT_1531686 [Irpex lacteus]
MWSIALYGSLSDPYDRLVSMKKASPGISRVYYTLRKTLDHHDHDPQASQDTTSSLQHFCGITASLHKTSIFKTFTSSTPAGGKYPIEDTRSDIPFHDRDAAVRPALPSRARLTWARIIPHCSLHIVFQILEIDRHLCVNNRSERRQLHGRNRFDSPT